jgi:hypothetical protein
MMVLFLWWGSANALPDSPLYAVKLSGEGVLVNLAGSPAEQARRHVSLAGERLNEIRIMESQGKLAQAGAAFDSYNEHLSGAIMAWRQVSGAEQQEIAELLLASIEAGRGTLQSYEGELAGMPASVRAEVMETLSNLETLRREVSAAVPEGTPGPTPQPTATVPAVPAGTATEETATVTPTATVGPQGTPTPPGTSTVAFTATPMPTVASTGTPTKGRPTQIPPPPAQTARAMLTRTPPGLARTPTRMPVRTVMPRATFTRPPAGGACDLRVSKVEVVCDAGGCASWAAGVHNSGSEPVTVSWVAELLVNARGGFEVVATMRGGQRFEPGTSTVTGGFCYSFPSEANNFKVRFVLETGQAPCRVEASSPASKPCEGLGGPPEPPGQGRGRTPGAGQSPPEPPGKERDSDNSGNNNNDKDKDTGKPPR